MAEQQPQNPKPQVQIQGMTNEQVSQVIGDLIRTLKEPSDEEKQKKLEEAERKKEFARQSVISAEQEMKNKIGLQRQCIHRNEKYHTFVATTTGNGDAVAICQICRKDYKWRATPDQQRQGLNLLGDYPGLTEKHLLQWEKDWPPIGEPPDRIKLLTRAGLKVPQAA